MLTTPNCSLLFQVILAIFVPYFYPEAKIGADFRDFFRLSRCKRGTQWEFDEMSPMVQCGTHLMGVTCSVSTTFSHVL